jgi:hypothetical protein
MSHVGKIISIATLISASHPADSVRAAFSRPLASFSRARARRYSS